METVAGEVVVMGDLFKRLPDTMEKWKRIAEDSRFLGLRISGLDRHELLAVIGSLIEHKDLTFKQRTKEREFLHEIPRIH